MRTNAASPTLMDGMTDPCGETADMHLSIHAETNLYTTGSLRCARLRSINFLLCICDSAAEYYDLSREEPQLLASMLTRLKAYRATAVDNNFKASPDHGCPTVRCRSFNLQHSQHHPFHQVATRVCSLCSSHVLSAPEGGARRILPAPTTTQLALRQHLLHPPAQFHLQRSC
jgi:hypothetical protein